jgi:hypothetical protein
MPGTYLIFGDYRGASSMCCASSAPNATARALYFHKLIGKSGRKGNMVDWREMLNADCPKRDASQLHDRCD